MDSVLDVCMSQVGRRAGLGSRAELTEVLVVKLHGEAGLLTQRSHFSAPWCVHYTGYIPKEAH